MTEPITYFCVVDGTVMRWARNRGASCWRCPNCNGTEYTETPPEPEEPSNG